MGGAFVKAESDGSGSLPVPASLEEAKAFLLQSDGNGGSLYDHLSELLLKVLEHRPQNALQYLEDISLEVKAAKLNTNNSKINQAKEGKDLEESTLDVGLAALQTNLFKSFEMTSGSDVQSMIPNEGDMSDLLEEAQYFEWAGIGLGKEETFRLMLSMKQLLESNPLKNVRFFGKIFGRQQDYFIVESEYKDGGKPDESEEPEQKQTEDSDSEVEEEDQNKEKKAKPVPVVESEVNNGTNKYTYWVTSNPAEPWVRLPNVTPQQIVAARKIKKFFTGNLDAKIVSYPTFPGTEKNYLRAQITRIASSTLVCPKGFFSVEDEDDSFEVPTLQINQEFEGMDSTELLQSNNWAHYHPYILPQGRCTFFSLKEEKDEEEEDENEIEEVIEEGPKLLTEVNEDQVVGKYEAWTTSLSSTGNQRYGHVIIRSNRWPGAYAFAKDDRFANVYIGFGQKSSVEPFSPPLPTPMMTQSQTQEEVDDPTVEEEETYEKSLIQEQSQNESGSGEGEEDGSEEESEEETEEDE